MDDRTRASGTRRARRARRSGQAIATILLSLALLGCQAAMSMIDPEAWSTPPELVPPPGHGPYTGTVADWPLWFYQHSFGAHCFDTLRCEVLYAGLGHGSGEPSPSFASYGRDRNELLSAGQIGIRNFPPPAVVAWQSKDGTEHRAQLDMGEIFKDRLIRHHVPREKILEDSGMGDPEIIVEVDDRTINVYMRTHIPLKDPTIPGNPYSDFDDELIRISSQRY
jgi:hypothetical protein